jgi:hypothetical protein
MDEIRYNDSGLKVLQLMWCILGSPRIVPETKLLRARNRILAILNYFYLNLPRPSQINTQIFHTLIYNLLLTYSFF